MTAKERRIMARWKRRADQRSRETQEYRLLQDKYSAWTMIDVLINTGLREAEREEAARHPCRETPPEEVCEAIKTSLRSIK